jgi:hypothetical protein
VQIRTQPPSLARLSRIAVGLARPSSRSRYVAAARRRIKTQPGPQARAGAGGCRVCGSANVAERVVSASFSAEPKQIKVMVCRPCGHVAMPENLFDYNTVKSEKQFELAKRVGTETVPGREFGMTTMAVDILRRSGLDILMYGVGRSMDNVHVQQLPKVSRVAIGDVMQFRDDAEFVDITKPATQKFDIVVASEVIEHFVQPTEEFPRLLSYLADDGVLVCSTNIYDGGKLEGHRYIFLRGHTSYYSPKSLRAIARQNKVHVDFRVPVAAMGKVGRRKRYVLMSRSQAVMDSVSDYFGSHMFAPSEPPEEPATRPY